VNRCVHQILSISGRKLAGTRGVESKNIVFTHVKGEKPAMLPPGFPVAEGGSECSVERAGELPPVSSVSKSEPMITSDGLAGFHEALNLVRNSPIRGMVIVIEVDNDAAGRLLAAEVSLFANG